MPHTAPDTRAEYRATLRLVPPIHGPSRATLDEARADLVGLQIAHYDRGYARGDVGRVPEAPAPHGYRTLGDYMLGTGCRRVRQ